MSFLNPFRSTKTLLDHSPQTGLSSPWAPSPNHLQSIVLSDIFGTDAVLPVTRGDAMKVPSITKARALVCGHASRLPLRAYTKGVETPQQPVWLSRTSSQVSPQQRMLWTVDDLLFRGYSLWAVERGAAGQITDAVRVPPEWWKFNELGEVEVNGETVPANSVILFSGPQEGLTDIGSRAIRQYQDLESTRAARLRNPIASIVLHATEEMNLTDDEINAMVDEYANNHRSGSLAVSWLPHNVNIEEHGTASPELFLQMENAINVQIAQLTNVPATLLDASIEGSTTLTYQNSETERSWFVDSTLSYWLTPIEARLSMDDVVPRGTYVQFDLSSLTAVPHANPTLED